MGVGAVVVGAAVAAAGFHLAWHDDRRQPPDTRARHYRDIDACPLTGKDGITAGTPAAEVWHGIQDASLRTHARVSYVPVTGEQSEGNARPYLNSLLQRSCDVVLTSGGPEVKAAEQAAPQHQKVGFVLVAGGSQTRNATVVKSGHGLRAEVAGAVEREVSARR